VQGSEAILGPIQEVGSPGTVVASSASAPEVQEQLQEQLAAADEDRDRKQQELAQANGAQTDKDSNNDKKNEDDDSGVDPSLGLLNAGPVQLKSDVEQPVTSGGMNATVEDPGLRD
jgi:hypothetical protein